MKNLLGPKTKIILRYLLPTLLVLLIVPFCVSEVGRFKEDFTGKEVKCAIALRDDENASALSAGFNYEMLKKFAEAEHFYVKIVSVQKKENYLDSLRQDKVDIVVVPASDSTIGGIKTSISIDKMTVWAVKDMKKSGRIKQMNSWLTHFSQSNEFPAFRASFYSTHNPYTRLQHGTSSHTISPYDHLFKKYAVKLGWDWRMLAALVYQESRFQIDAQSHRGAYGLMQLVPNTADRFSSDDTNLLDPEENIKVGVQYIARLQRFLRKYKMGEHEKFKFTLAAYNAGEGRIQDCINYASTQDDINSAKWDDIVKVIPDMRQDSILQSDTVKLGKFKGYETIAYVESVFSVYNAFKKICPETK